MSSYVTEEEQVEAIKAFFKRNSNLILMAFILLLAVVFGYRYWGWREQKIQTEASSVYESLLAAVADQDKNKVQAYSDRLIQTFDNTTYAAFARLISVKYAVNAGDLTQAKNQLLQVSENATLEVLKPIARLRLARLLMNDQNYPAALEMLAKVEDQDYRFVADELRGDIYVAQHDLPQAQKSYQQARLGYEQAGIKNNLLALKLK